MGPLKILKTYLECPVPEVHPARVTRAVAQFDPIPSRNP